MTDDAEIERVAAEHLQARGPGAIDWLLEQAELDYAQGDAETAGMWREIAEAANDSCVGNRAAASEPLVIPQLPAHGNHRCLMPLHR
jgi:hypothetical protein